MEIKIQINTPKGYAKKIEHQLRPWLIGSNKPKEMFVNKDDDTLYWVVETTIKRCLKIQRNVTMFETMMKGILNNPKVKKMAKLTEEQRKELDDMIFNHTKITIVKRATAEEIVESNKTFWQTIKEKFKKVSPS